MIKQIQHAANESPPWSSFVAGTTLYAGGLVLFAGAEWQCLETHCKEVDRKPHDDSLFWIRVPPKWRTAALLEVRND